MNKYICIHGHFYQPPRENPWLESIEPQDSAHPYHDWNERITAECYAPNASSRILDDHGKIERIVNNYAKISFNFGPTLLRWMEHNSPDVYRAILEADKESQKYFSGHGSALAQCYHHMIMPLANPRDKQTQTLWGIRDFESRFNRKPEGMWLPETAVDIETLETLVESDVKFTILAPHQAKRVRPLRDGKWHDVSGGSIDTRHPYRIKLPSGKSIDVFFYDGPTSRAVAFENLLARGETLAHRLLRGFNGDHTQPQLAHIATDGETYGHHHKFGDMALAYALHFIESSGQAKLTNYGEYLEKFPPTHEAEIFDNTSWSCAHGIERWRSDCGCNTGAGEGWNQAWRAPLREGLDWLRDILAPAFREKAQPLLKDPWRARDQYIDVILRRSPENAAAFLERHAARKLNGEEKVVALKLLELQSHAMLMYTSCGWFFNDISGIETVQILRYAGRVLQLGRQVFGDILEMRFMETLERAKSNLPAQGNGKQIYERHVKNAIVDLPKLCAHLAGVSLFEELPEQSRIYCYSVKFEDHQSLESGKARLVMGKTMLTSTITGSLGTHAFAALNPGDYNLKIYVRPHSSEETYAFMTENIRKVFQEEACRRIIEETVLPQGSGFPETARCLEQHFGLSSYSLSSLFRNEQKKILDTILKSALAANEPSYRSLYESLSPMLRFFRELAIDPPKAIYIVAEMVLNLELRQALEDEAFDMARIVKLIEEARFQAVELDSETLEYALRQSLERMAGRFRAAPDDISTLQKLESITNLLQLLPFQVNLWKTQNICHDICVNTYPSFKEKAVRRDEAAKEWTHHFRAWAEKISVRVA